MAYAHCHVCEWQQDDFWCARYNPLRSLLNWEQDLLEGELNDQFSDDPEFVDREGAATLREVIARECERAARMIRQMAWRNEVEYRQGQQLCPTCSHPLDVD